MKKIMPLFYKFLRKTLNYKELDFKTTEDLQLLDEFLGQKRALEAVIFGIEIKSYGYNLYAMGPSGIGKYSLVRTVLDAAALKKSTPPDWCYIYNFENTQNPIALSLPAGMGITLQKDMKAFIRELSTSIVVAFESDEYHAQMEEVNKQFNLQRKTGKKIVDNSKSIKIPRLYKERHEKEKALQLQYTSAVIKPLIDKLKIKYQEFSNIVSHLSAIENDILNNVNDLIKQDENNILSFNFESQILFRYQINLLVNNECTKGAPVIFEENPSYSNLICRVEHTIEFGSQVTNFTLIRAGALHKANGGYLIIEARKIKKEKNAWEGLKRALYAKNILIEPVEQLTETARPVSPEPMPIPLDIKIILLGNRKDYYHLSNHDPDFGELFKVAVDFDEQIERNSHTIHLYSRLIATIIKNEKLKPFHASAVAEIIDYSTRIAEDTKKLSTHIRSIDDLIVESDYWAETVKQKIVKDIHVKRAINAKIHRMDRSRELYYEEIFRNFILIKTTGKITGQVNCLSVVQVGKFSYGHPTRVTAKVRAGKGTVMDIQHEVDLAGPIHSKATLILSHFLASRYNTEHLFSLSASISFEQIYGKMDGDSASIGEVCALLSAIAEIPIKQSIAVTGSIDQYGNAQAVGGINEKIEGFYDICKLRGLNGQQGVIIPSINVANLMLRDEVVQAAKTKKFFIYPVKTVDEAVYLLTDCIAGERNKTGEFNKNTFNYYVEKKLLTFNQIRTREKVRKKDF